MATRTTTQDAEEPVSTPAGEETSIGLDEDLTAALTYVLGFVTGLALFFLEKENSRVRFHAVQSTIVFGGIFVLNIVVGVIQSAIWSMMYAGGSMAIYGTGLVSMLFGFLSLGISLVALGLWGYLMLRTYQGHDPRIPVAASIADRYT